MLLGTKDELVFLLLTCPTVTHILGFWASQDILEMQSLLPQEMRMTSQQCTPQTCKPDRKVIQYYLRTISIHTFLAVFSITSWEAFVSWRAWWARETWRPADHGLLVPFQRSTLPGGPGGPGTPDHRVGKKIFSVKNKCACWLPKSFLRKGI